MLRSQLRQIHWIHTHTLAKGSSFSDIIMVYGDVCVSVCLSVRVCVCVHFCLSVREHVCGTAGPIFTKPFLQIPYGSGSVHFWRRCDRLCTSGFMVDVTFGRSGPPGDAWLASLRYRGGVWCLWVPCLHSNSLIFLGAVVNASYFFLNVMYKVKDLDSCLSKTCLFYTLQHLFSMLELETAEGHRQLTSFRIFPERLE